jgi:hypothetical protein
MQGSRKTQAQALMKFSALGFAVDQVHNQVHRAANVPSWHHHSVFEAALGRLILPPVSCVTITTEAPPSSDPPACCRVLTPHPVVGPPHPQPLHYCQPAPPLRRLWHLRLLQLLQLHAPWLCAHVRAACHLHGHTQHAQASWTGRHGWVGSLQARATTKVNAMLQQLCIGGRCQPACKPACIMQVPTGLTQQCS